MNWDIIEGNWEQAKGKIKTMWGDFTEDELMEMKGSAQLMRGKIQEKYGLSKEDAEKKMEELEKLL